MRERRQEETDKTDKTVQQKIIDLFFLYLRTKEKQVYLGSTVR